jgi:hypothetical protein
MLREEANVISPLADTQIKNNGFKDKLWRGILNLSSKIMPYQAPQPTKVMFNTDTAVQDAKLNAEIRAKGGTGTISTPKVNPMATPLATKVIPQFATPKPIQQPTVQPSQQPTVQPLKQIQNPTIEPSIQPTQQPSVSPTVQYGKAPQGSNIKGQPWAFDWTGVTAKQPDVVPAITQAAQKYSLDPSLLFDIAASESSLNPNSDPWNETGNELYKKAGYPKGLFQFIDTTWQQIMRELGRDPGTSQFDPYANAEAAAYSIAKGRISWWNASKDKWGQYHPEGV